ncbi:hypothetical protein U9M48_003457 [Paspalum notatum var. saurae]|uniref:Uncharacterized protein n=1 Tax=Paspalum notatum var. saurae TaxID=547442 RepID=A0AAQ3PR54_PASNO
MWLTVNNRCWTSDRLARRGLPINQHAPSPIRLMKPYTIFVAHVCWQEKFGSRIFSWWSQSSKALPKDLRKGLNSLFILVSWELWKHRNECVFLGARPAVQAVLQSIGAEGHLWCLAGALDLQEFIQRATLEP